MNHITKPSMIERHLIQCGLYLTRYNIIVYIDILFGGVDDI